MKLWPARRASRIEANQAASWQLATLNHEHDFQWNPDRTMKLCACGRISEEVIEGRSWPSQLDAAMYSIYLYGNWRNLTRNMITPYREAAADAVDRYAAHLKALDPKLEGWIVGADRWWRQ